MVEIVYTNSTRDQLAHVELLRRVYAPRLAFCHYFWIAYWAAMAALGVYVSMIINHIFMAMVFVAMFVLYAVRAVPYSRVWKWSAEQINRGAAIKQIRLRLNEEGLHETVEGLVESFAPWNAVRSFAVVDEHLLIELAGDLWANVPRTTVVEGSAAFDQLVQTLRSRGIAEKTR